MSKTINIRFIFIFALHNTQAAHLFLLSWGNLGVTSMLPQPDYKNCVARDIVNEIFTLKGLSCQQGHNIIKTAFPGWQW